MTSPELRAELERQLRVIEGTDEAIVLSGLVRIIRRLVDRRRP